MGKSRFSYCPSLLSLLLCHELHIVVVAVGPKQLFVSRVNLV